MKQKSKNTNLENLLTEYSFITDEQLNRLFEKCLENAENSKYDDNLRELFTFALKHKELFTNNSIKLSGDAKGEISCYIDKWISKYIKDRENEKLATPLKNYGEKDEALISRVRASTRESEEVVQNYIDGHYLFMSAENMNGAILEEYLAEVLEPAGWQWCAGSVFRAIDFCYLSNEKPILLQVKNKYNTENSSSSAIRNGTEIKKWNRLSRPKVATGKFTPIPNWDTLHEIVQNPSLNDQLTEEKYLNYIETNSTSELDILGE